MWKFKKIVLPILVVFVGFFLLIYFIKSAKKIEKIEKKQKSPLVEIANFHPVSEAIKVIGNGTVKPKKSVNIIPQVSGVIVFASEEMQVGSKFRKGDLLFKIDSAEYELRLQTAKAQLSSAKVNLLKEKENQKIAEYEWQEYKKENPEEIPSLLTLREPQYKLALANKNAAQASVGISELNLSRTEIKAPFSGVVKSKNVSVGQFVAPGQIIGTIYNTEKAEIIVHVKDKELKWLKSMKSKHYDALVSANYGGKLNYWNGYLSKIESELDTKSRLIRLIINVDKPFNYETKLIFGLFVKVEIAADSLNNFYKLSRYILYENEKVAVEKDGKLEFRKIEIAKFDDNFMYVTDGITSQDNVIVSRLDLTLPGMSVRVIEK